jgi:demethylmacrocin O-methyltransferase
MSLTVRRWLVRTVKPRVGDRTWARLRALGRPGSRGSRAEPATARETLTDLGRRYGTDKVRHGYTAVYERHLEHLRDVDLTLFEIGIGGARRRGEGGASLRMWKDYFPRGQVVGLDIADKSFVAEPRIHVHQGDQTDRAVLERIVAEHGPVQVVIDDGSHRPEHVRATFAVLFPLLADGGTYVIEDTQTSYWPRWGGSEDRSDPDTTMGLVKDLVDGLNWVEFLDEGYEPTYTDLNITGIHAYHNVVILEKGHNQGWTNKDRIGRPRQRDRDQSNS